MTQLLTYAKRDLADNFDNRKILNNITETSIGIEPKCYKGHLGIKTIAYMFRQHNG